MESTTPIHVHPGLQGVQRQKSAGSNQVGGLDSQGSKYSDRGSECTDCMKEPRGDFPAALAAPHVCPGSPNGLAD